MKSSYIDIQVIQYTKGNTVEAVLSGTLLSGHPLLSGHVVKSQKFHNSFIERSPLLSGRGHIFDCPKPNFSLF